MSEYGIGRWADITTTDRQGSGAKGMAANGAMTEGHLLAVDTTGSAADTGVPQSNVGVFPMGFGISWQGGTATGTDIAGHRLISRACVPVSVEVRAEVAPISSPYTIDIRRVRPGSPETDDSILSAPISLAAGTATGTGTIATDADLQPGDYLTVTASQSGGTAPENVFIEILVRLA